MPTLIDSLVVEIGLDAKNFTKGQKEAVESANTALKEIETGAKGMEYQATRSTSALGGIKTQAIELFAAFTGGKGLLEFSTQLIHSNASLGRLERNLGVSASTISKWQGAARIFGGDAASMAQSFTAVSDALAGWKIGIISPMVADFRAISTAGGTVIDINKGVEQSFRDLSANLRAIHDRDPAQAGLLGRRLGLDPALFDLLVQGPKALQQVLDYVNKIGVATRQDTDSFGELEKRISQMGLKAESIGRKMLSGRPAEIILKAADFLNMTPTEAFNYFRGEKKKGADEPGTPLFGPPVDTKLEPTAAPAASGAGPVGDQSSAGQGAPASSGAFASQVEKEAFIRSESLKRGLMPDVMMKVAKSEGFDSFLGDNGTSGSAFQLHVTPGGRGNAVGDEFVKRTGKSPLDPANERLAIQFALDDIRAHGLTAYHGAARVGLGPTAGGAGGGGGSTTTTKIDVHGPVNVYPPQGVDGEQMAGKFVNTLRGQGFAAQANDGQN